jgi:hypothetical protein
MATGTGDAYKDQEDDRDGLGCDEQRTRPRCTARSLAATGKKSAGQPLTFSESKLKWNCFLKLLSVFKSFGQPKKLRKIRIIYESKE